MANQHQKSGDSSINVQANEIIVNQGITYAEVRDIARDVFNANFYELAGKAKHIAEKRAEEITESFLNKLLNENPKGFTKSQDPDFQHALFTVQKEYARNGDKNLGDLLVDLLVDRSKQDKRDILQIVLNESLNTAPKLTNEQLATLAVIFLLRYTSNAGIDNQQSFGNYLDKRLSPFVASLIKNDSCYRHLEFAGCGSISIGSSRLENIIGQAYQTLFSKGFDCEEIIKRNISIGQDPRIFAPCLWDNKKLQVKAVNKHILEKLLDAFLINNDDKKNIIALFDINKMSNEEIKQKCLEMRPYMEQVFDVWSNSSMKNFTLTSVGIAIGHANIKRFVGEFADLKIWIN